MFNYLAEVDIPIGSKLRIGVPAEQPENSIRVLQSHFLSRQAVKAAYFGMIQVSPPNSEIYFTFSVGILCEEKDFQEEQRSALETLVKVPSEQLPVTVLPFSEEYFTDESILFYERQSLPKKVGIFGRLFGNK